MTKSLTLTALLIAASALQVRSEDWPQWGGPARDHKSADSGLLQKWPEAGPKRLWLQENLGLGYSGPAIVSGRIYIMGARDGKEFLIALNEKDGKEIWAAEMSPMLENGPWGEGPRGTPTVQDGRVYTMSGKGTLIAADIKDGKVLWKKAMSDLGGKEQDWGYTESPLVENGVVYCTPGGKQGAVAALDAKTGELKWQSKDFVVERTHYSSLVATDLNGTRQLIRLTERKLAGLDAKTGKLLWQVDYPGKVAVIPTPIVKGNKIYVTAGYDTGASKLIEIGPGNEVKEIYQNTVMRNHHGGVVLHNEHIYGFSDINRGNWVCQKFDTGDQVWAEKAIGKGAVTYADNRLYCLSEDKGIVALVEPSPEGYKEHGKFTLEAQSGKRSKNGKVWTHPVIANGKLYLRDQEFLSCYDVSSGAKTALK
jgi:outer membrane protein assembly factor BamB